jgi:hypothetical protein
MTVLPNNYVGFAVDKKSSRDIESIAVISTCTLNKIPFKIVNGAKEFKKDAAYCQYIPVGNIDFVQDVLEVKVKPNYYPEYLRKYFKREIWETNEWPLGKKVFIKPSDKYKRFTGFVTNGGYKKKKKPPYVCSEVINIKNEWRYYICNGEILFVNWYAGREDIEIDAPQINISFDKKLCCCLDMGELLNGDIVLIEQQHPFSCGWYGKCTTENNAKYTKWLAYGWDSLRNTTYG